MPSHSLEQLQAWMQSVITHHGGVDSGIASEEARRALNVEVRDLSDVILPGPAQSSIERLAIYGNAYYARLLHCLQELFPACRAAVGEEIFDEFAFAYLQAHAPTSYTLGRLANQFVEFLARSGDEFFVGEEPPQWARFLVELAELEWAIDDVFDGPGSEGLPFTLAESIASLPATAWPKLRLIAAPSVRLLAFEFPVNEYFSALRRGESPELPELEPSFVLLTRREYVVRRRSLSSDQYQLLRALVAGQSVVDALRSAYPTASAPAQLEQELSNWFSIWSSAGCFMGIQTHPKTFPQP